MEIISKKTNVSILIPCYNVQEFIGEVVRNVPKFIEYIILVDDFSSDNTLLELKKIKLTDNRVRIIEHRSNKGVGGAMKTAFAAALEMDSDYFIKIDGDGQMDPTYISDLLEPLLEGEATFTKGNRFYNLQYIKKMPFIRRIGNLGMSFLVKAASGFWHVFDPTNGFFCVHRNIIEQIELENIADDYFFESSLLIEMSYTDAIIKDVTMPAIYNDEKSNLSIFKVLITFPPKLLKAMVKRVLYSYFLYDFNIASIYILLGFPLFIFGLVFGGINWWNYSNLGVGAPLGTIMVATLTIVLGFQLLLAAIQYDVSSNK